MRTHIVIVESLLRKAMPITRARSKREVVDIVLRALVARNAQQALRDLVGAELIDPDHDVRAVRAGMDRDRG